MKGEKHNLAGQQMAASRKDIDWKWKKENVATGGNVHNNHEQSKAPQAQGGVCASWRDQRVLQRNPWSWEASCIRESSCFPDAESVSKAIEKVLNVVKDFKLVGMWVTSRVSNTEEGYTTTKKIHQVSLWMFYVFFIYQCNAWFLTIRFSSDYSKCHYWFCCKIEQVFWDGSGHLEGRKWKRFAAPVTSWFETLP